jgi:hypothetical protein
MKCCYCESELVKDSFGFLCPNEKCKSVDGKIKLVERLDGTKCWCRNGRFHREDGPAVEYTGGSKEWYTNGLLHREDGPAVERPDGTTEYWINGKKIK